MLRRVELWLLLSVVAAACSGDADQEAATFLSQGSGPTNEAPLEPMRPGSRLVRDVTRTVGNAYLRQGRRYVRLSAPAGNEPQMELSTDGGALLLHGTRWEGWFAKPYLLVPATVRVGMKWRTGDEHGRYTYTVVAREVKDTAYGPDSVVWQIDQTHSSGSQLQRLYVEGVGLLDTARLGEERQPVRAVIPLEEQAAVTEPELPGRVTPTLLSELAPELGNLEVSHVSAITPADGGPTLVILRGDSGCFLSGGHSRCPESRCIELGDTNAAFSEGVTASSPYVGPHCPLGESRGGGFAAQLWGEARRVLFVAGPTHWLDPGDGLAVRDGGVHRLTEGGWSYSLESVEGAAQGLQLIGGWKLFDTFADFTLPTGLRVLPPAPGEELYGLYHGGVLATAGLRVDRLEVPSLVGYLGSGFTAHAKPAGPELLAFTSDGLVDAVSIEPAGVGRRRLAALEIPPTQRVVAAVQTDSALFVVSHQPSADRHAGVGDLGTVFVHRTPAVAAQQSVPIGRAGAVLARMDGNDLLVCWPPSETPLHTSGWRLGGVPVHTVERVTDSCALAIRDLSASPSGYGAQELAPYWRTAEVDLPGIGRTLLVVDIPTETRRGESLNLTEAPAELSDGRLVTRAHQYGPGGIRLGGVRHTIYPFSLHKVAADAEGGGLWAHFDSAGALIGGESVSYVTEREAVLEFPDESGGVVLREVSAHESRILRVTADGAVAPLNLPEETIMPLARLADGRLCGLHSPRNSPVELLCANTEGEVVSRFPMPHRLNVPQNDANIAWYPVLRDGTLLALNSSAATSRNDSPVLRIDLDTGAVEELPGLTRESLAGYGRVHAFRRAPDGEIWAVRTPQTRDDVELGRVTPHGFLPEPLGELARALFNRDNGRLEVASFSVFDDYALVNGCLREVAACEAFWMRLPRPGRGGVTNPQAPDGEECGPHLCTDWSECRHADLCTELGTRTRLCRPLTWQGGACVATEEVETEGCGRDTEGAVCPERCTEWSECAAPRCALEGQQTRTCTPGVCAEGRCDHPGEGAEQTLACELPDPNGEPCGDGVGASCQGGVCLERTCSDGVDNDGDGSTDCDDTLDCEHRPCDPDNPGQICCPPMGCACR